LPFFGNFVSENETGPDEFSGPVFLSGSIVMFRFRLTSAHGRWNHGNCHHHHRSAIEMYVLTGAEKRARRIREGLSIDIAGQQDAWNGRGAKGDVPIFHNDGSSWRIGSLRSSGWFRLSRTRLGHGLGRT
jgi:hypothetical protein